MKLFLKFQKQFLLKFGFIKVFIEAEIMVSGDDYFMFNGYIFELLNELLYFLLISPQSKISSMN